MDDDRRELITTRAGFHDALRAGFARAAERGCRELWLVDTDFADWPLGERAVIGELTSWAHAHRRITLLAQNFDELVRRHPRWVDWRRHWSHIVGCRTNTELEGGQMPTLLLASELLLVRLADPQHWRGVTTSDPADLVLARETIDALLQRSAEAFPATILGL